MILLIVGKVYTTTIKRLAQSISAATVDRYSHTDPLQSQQTQRATGVDKSTLTQSICESMYWQMST